MKAYILAAEQCSYGDQPVDAYLRPLRLNKSLERNDMLNTWGASWENIDAVDKFIVPVEPTLVPRTIRLTLRIWVTANGPLRWLTMEGKLLLYLNIKDYKGSIQRRVFEYPSPYVSTPQSEELTIELRNGVIITVDEVVTLMPPSELWWETIVEGGVRVMQIRDGMARCIIQTLPPTFPDLP